jgi:2'-5' RNA ligase
MCGVVTLLSDPFKSQVESLWRTLGEECGLSNDNLLKIPHFSLQVAEGYDLDQLLPIMNEIASEIQPFKVHTAGLGLFNGEKVVLYIALAKDSQLLHFQELVWKRVSQAAIEINPLYAPRNWMPHITLTHDNQNYNNLSCMMARLAPQPFNWELQLDNIAYIYQDDDGSRCISYSTTRL